MSMMSNIVTSNIINVAKSKLCANRKNKTYKSNAKPFWSKELSALSKEKSVRIIPGLLLADQNILMIRFIQTTFLAKRNFAKSGL